eukprot:m.259386 g.259386  ORF g.259386 m.259386 type:complete len:333 (+) comp19662_c0_seq12:37-1035(+)
MLNQLQWVFLAGCTAAAVFPTAAALDLYLLPNATSVDIGAVCLDGSAPGYYATFTNVSELSTSWVLYFKGGGWCYDESACAKRSNSELGSSHFFPKTFKFGGIMDADPKVNPDFANFNRVVLWYCDGASFSGNADAPVPSPKTIHGGQMYFRGRRVLDALLQDLLDNHGLDKATEVLLSGGSAGGLSTFLHADYVRSQLPASVKKFKAAPVSGFFLLHDTAAGVPQYPNNMHNVFKMQNSSGGVNAKCLQAMGGPAAPEAWKCIFANYSYAHTESPIFVINSAVDSWQMGNVQCFQVYYMIVYLCVYVCAPEGSGPFLPLVSFACIPRRISG